jgi:hypothetical protein
MGLGIFERKSNSLKATSGPQVLAVIPSACMFSDVDPYVKRECHMVRVLEQHSDTVVPDSDVIARLCVE